MAWAPVKAKTIKHDHKIHYTFYLRIFIFACSIVITEYDATPYRGMAQEKNGWKIKCGQDSKSAVTLDVVKGLSRKKKKKNELPPQIVLPVPTTWKYLDCPPSGPITSE